MPPSSKTSGPATGPSAPTSGPAAAPKGKTPAATPTAASKTPPATSRFGELYFQPTRETGETVESYRERLDTINKEAKNYPAPKPKKNSAGSFTLLTQYDKNGPTGETRFDDESATLQKKSEDIKKTISRYEELIKRADADDKKIYRGLVKQEEGKLREIEDALDIFLVAGGDHYMTGKTDASFATTPREIKNGRLNRALEQVAMAKGEAVGKEIRRKRREESEKTQQEIEGLRQDYSNLRQEYSELRSKAKELLKGNLPGDVKDDLHNTVQALERILAYDGTSELEIPADSDTSRMIANLRKIIDGTALESEQSILEKTPGEILEDILSDGAEITRGELMARGLKQEDAENLIALLKQEGILKDNS